MSFKAHNVTNIFYDSNRIDQIFKKVSIELC